jgi:sulfatase modifying factor 1
VLLLFAMACSDGLPSKALPAVSAASPGGGDTGAAQQDSGQGAGAPDTGEGAGADSTGGDGTVGDSGAGDSADGGGPEDTAPEGPCPADMVPVEDTFCVDAYEARLQEWDGSTWVDASPYDTVDGRQVRAVPAAGELPQAYISGDEAADACAAAGKRLCTSEEWLAACRGPDDFTWPYGDSYRDGACNDDYPGSHPVTDYFGTSTGVWDGTHMNDPGINQQPDTVAFGGEFDECESAWGAFDLHGNLHEWVDDPDGTFRGGFYADAAINGAGCGYVTTAHTTTYHDYSTGFRCCAALTD